MKDVKNTTWACRLIALVAVLVLLPSTGCTRRFYRLRADNEVDSVLAEKDVFPAWRIEQYHIYPDPRARFGDPTNPDRPPMPPDDPAAYMLAPQPQNPGHAGVDLIEGTGYLELLARWNIENRATLQEGDVNKRQEKKEVGFLLTLDQACELGLINSRVFQERREDLFLTALPVTLQRFGFAYQFFATNEAIRERTGTLTPEGPHNRWRNESAAGFTKLFSTGALLLFRFANQTVIELTGPQPRHTTSVSTINLDITQPLLRGGGKAVTLEPLTQAERNLLYEVRDYARFRKQFFVAIAGGDNITDVFGLQAAFTGVDLSPAATAPLSGYLPTLLRAALVENESRNLRDLRETHRLFEAIKEGGDVSQLQVDQVLQSMLNRESSLLQQELNYRDSLDRLKIQLGLPITIPLELDDSPIKPLSTQMNRFDEVIKEFDDARAKASTFDKRDDAGKLRGRLKDLIRTTALTEKTSYRDVSLAAWAELEKLDKAGLVKDQTKLSDERRALLDRKTDLEGADKTLSPRERDRLRELDWRIDLIDLENSLRAYEAKPWTDPNTANPTRIHATLFRDVINDYMIVLGEARRERFDMVRRSWPELPRVCLDGTDLLTTELDHALTIVAQAALTNRFDLMNHRAQLVDTWRKITVQANTLMGIFNVQYHMDTSTPVGLAKPTAFSGSRTRNQLILNGELPLTRVLERNNYRASLIAFQRDRRDLMSREDLIVDQVRREIRQLRVLAENYRIQKQAVEIAYFQVENSLDTFRSPPVPGGGRNAAADAAALTQQLLNAQGSLPAAQNNLVSTYITYLTARMQLYRDMELMPLDFRNVWIDEVATCYCSPKEAGVKQPEPPSDELPAPKPLPEDESKPTPVHTENPQWRPAKIQNPEGW